MLTVDLIRRGAARYADRPAIYFGDQSLSYIEVDLAANRFANLLAGLGVDRGSKVGLLLGNGLWSIPVDFGCVKAGAVRVPLNARLSVDEQHRMLADTGVRLLIHDPGQTGRAADLARRIDGLRTVGLGAPGAGGGQDLVAAMGEAKATDPMLPAAPEDPVLLLFTSGTTGTLKAVTHSQASYAAVVANVLANLVSPGRDSVMLHAASLIHASGTFVLPYWLRGGASAVLPGFDPADYVAAIEKYRATEINLVPTMLGLLFSSGALDGADVSSIDSVIYGASPMPRPVLEQALRTFGPKLVQYYGQTEAPLCMTVLDKADHEDERLWGSCGHPAVDAEVRLVDTGGAEAGRGEVGEIQVRAPFGMLGYFQAPERNGEMFAGDGWLRTRDMATVDDRGYLYLVDRRSDMIVTGGYNVYPREVEDALLTHPEVAEAAVVAAPDATWVEAVTAFVRLRPDGAAATAEATEAELQDTVRGLLAGYKVPKRVHFVEDIPKTAVGKILRRALRDPLWSNEGTGR